MKNDIYCTSFCNQPHRLRDGKPVGHECYVMPTEALHAEREGNTAKALDVLSSWKNRRAHNGLRPKSAEVPEA